MAESTHPYRILLADDEEAITTHLGPFLERAGFEVMIAGDGEATVRLVDEVHPDLIVLDVLMPRLDGRETLRRLRRASNWTSVILLTQVGSPVERAVALDEGADDYPNKPFEPYELVARIRAVLRRSAAGGPSLAGARQLRSGSLELDRQARRVLLQGRELPLTAKAISVLEYMMLHPDEVLTRERLLDAAGGPGLCRRDAGGGYARRRCAAPWATTRTTPGSSRQPSARAIASSATWGWAREAIPGGTSSAGVGPAPGGRLAVGAVAQFHSTSPRRRGDAAGPAGRPGQPGIEGSGLGLALVRAIVTRHRGTLAIRSRLGQGTLASLRLPAAG